LVLHRRDALSVERVAEDLWDGQPPQQCGAAVRVYISHLRKALGDKVIETRPSGYQLHLGPESLDADKFEALLHQGHAALASGDPGAASTLRDALSLWRGQAYADVADVSFAEAEVARLEEARLTGLEGRIDADLADGRHREVVGELETLCS